MKTIKLKTKNRKLQILKIIILLLSLLFIIISNITIVYDYYYISEDGKYYNLGYSKKENLINESVLEYVNTIKNNNIEIIDFNINKNFQKKIIIKLKKDINYSDFNIKTQIQKNIYIITYATKIKCNDNYYYILFKDKEKIKEKNCLIIQRDFINLDKISTFEKIK